MGRRARLGLAHALAWIGWGAAAALVAQQALEPASLALAGAVAAAVAALAMLVPQRSPRGAGLGALAISLVALAACGVQSWLAGALEAALLPPLLAGAAAMHARAMRAAAAADPGLAPRIRPAPTLLALGVGAALAAGADALGQPQLVVLAAAAVAQVVALALQVRASALDGPADEAPDAPLSLQQPPPARMLPLLALAVAGAAAVAALRPALSAIGADELHAAGPTALLLLVGGLAGPPLARLVDRLPLGRGSALLATLAGVAALAAPIARPGALDVVAAAVLGVAIAAVVALAELARRAGVVLAPRAAAVLLLAAAAGTGVAALLLTAVPVPDVVLGASIACLVAGLGAWAPAPRERVAPG